MNAAAIHLFYRLQHSEESVQYEAVAQLAMLLEQSTYLDRRDPAWRLVLPDDLLEVRLSPHEIKEVLNEAVSLLSSDQLRRNIKMSLVKVIAINGDLEHGKTLLQFFSAFAETFNEQEAFSFLASFTQFLLRVDDVTRLQMLLEKYKALRLLESFQRSDSARLRESAVRLLIYLRKPPQS